MKRSSKKPRKINKGTPSALILSILIHTALFLLAGLLVVFTVVKKEEPKFEPPKAVERPKMKLRKPKAKVKKTSQPKSTTRIVTKNKAVMPDIQLPEMSGMGDGLSGGVGNMLDIMPEAFDVSIFGDGLSIGNDFEGTFYDFKRGRSGRPIPMNDVTFAEKLTQFVRSGWDVSYISKYYHSPQKLYATAIMIPTTKSVLGPRAFGEDTQGWAWMVHYKGKLVYPEDIKFRFWGVGDDLLLVRVNGKLVLNGNFHREGSNTYITDIGGLWDSNSSDDAMYWYGSNKARVGDWIELKAGEAFDMEVMIGEVPGGEFSAMLTVQVDGVEYELNRQGGPILPMFMTAEPSRSLQDSILSNLVQGEALVTDHPVFRDYHIAQKTNSVDTVAANVKESGITKPKKSDWTSADGRKLEAEYLSVFAGNVVLKTSGGKQLKIPIDKLCLADREYIELMNPPKFTMDFIRLSENHYGRYKQSFLEMEWGKTLPRVNDFTFGAKVKQTSVESYNQELKLEYFAIGQELLGDKYVLLDRQSSTFTPTKENGKSFKFTGEPIEFLEIDLDGQMRGVKPSDNLTILLDEWNQIIQYSTSKSWLWEYIENLKELPVGAYMDKTCTRVNPTSPKPTRW